MPNCSDSFDDHMNFIGIIPARYASKRFPGKPLARILGKPMIQHVYTNAKNCSILDEVFIATDDDQIFQSAIKFGAKVFMTSSKHLSGTERCGEVNNVLLEQGIVALDDVVINIQGDEPFIDDSLLNLLASSFSDDFVDIATLLKQIHNKEDLFDPNKVKAVTGVDGRVLYFSRSPIPYLRDIPEESWLKNHTFYKHIGIYAYRSGTLKELTGLPEGELEIAESLEQLRWIEQGYSIYSRITERENIAIDTPEDLDKLNKRLGEKDNIY